MNKNTSLFCLFTAKLFSEGEKSFPICTSVCYEFFNGSEELYKVTQNSLKWLQKEGYIKISPCLCEWEDVYYIHFTEKSVKRWFINLPQSKTDIIDAIKHESFLYRMSSPENPDIKIIDSMIL